METMNFVHITLLHLLHELISTTLTTIPRPLTSLGGTYQHGTPLKSTLMGSNPGVAVGFVIHSKQGSFIMTGFYFIEQASVLVVEATTIRDGIKAALQKGCRRIQVEGEDQIIINAMQTQMADSSDYLRHSQNMISCCLSISLTCIYCESNMIVEWMAKLVVRLDIILFLIFLSHLLRNFLF